MIIDSHCHASDRWYEPVETLLFRMDACGVDRAVLVQLLGAFDNSEPAALARRHPDRLSWVGAIAPEELDPWAQLQRLAAAGMAGVRLRPGARSPGEDPLAIWRAAEAAGLAVSCVGSSADLTSESFTAIVRAVPNLLIVLEHLGGLARPDVGDRAAALPKVLALAAHANVQLKVPGLGQLAPRKPSLDEAGSPLDLSGVSALLDTVVAAFGADRLMWGSDFPPVAAREGYANALNWTRDLLAKAGHDVTAIFGASAERIFRGR